MGWPTGSDAPSPQGLLRQALGEQLGNVARGDRSPGSFVVLVAGSAIWGSSVPARLTGGAKCRLYLRKSQAETATPRAMIPILSQR